MAAKKKEDEIEIEESVAEKTGEPVEDEGVDGTGDRYKVRMILDQGIGMRPGDLCEIGHTRANRWHRLKIAQIVNKITK